MKTVNGKNRINKGIAAILACIFTILLIAVPFLVVFVTGAALPAQYSETYYGELTQMYSRLKNAEGKKIVIIGNSSVAFGVDSALMEELLADAGLTTRSATLACTALWVPL
ncbi:MAG: hypothetical protein LUD19_01655 [Clostridia bacterium]|nr:hypothetical protein [Clostridia bacterium]